MIAMEDCIVYYNYWFWLTVYDILQLPCGIIQSTSSYVCRELSGSFSTFSTRLNIVRYVGGDVSQGIRESSIVKSEIDGK
jgi:hypothetical protein